MEELLAIWVMGMATVVAVWTLRTVSRQLERRHERARASRRLPEHDALPERVAELERLVHGIATVEDRIAEVEERQDFAERLLTQSVREALPGDRP